MSMRRAVGIRAHYDGLAGLIEAAGATAADTWCTILKATGSHAVTTRLWADLCLGEPPTTEQKRRRRK